MIINQKYGLAIFGALSFFFWGMLGVSIGALLPNATEEFSMSSTSAGMVFVFWSIGFSAGSFAAERLLHMVGATTVLSALSFVAAAATWAQFQVGGYVSFVTLFAVLGLCGGAIFTASHTLFGSLFPARRASALAVLDLVFSVGNMAGPLVVVAILGGGLIWQSFFMVACIGFLSCGVLFAVHAVVGRKSGQTQKANTGSEPESKINNVPILPILCLVAASFALGATEWSQNVWFVTYGIDRGMSAEFARICLSGFTGGMVAARIVVILLNSGNRSSMLMTVFFALAIVGNLLLLLSTVDELVFLGNVFLGVGIGALFPIFLGRAMDGHPSAAARYSMLMIVALTFGGQVASFTLGAIAEYVGTRKAFMATSIAVVAMIISFEIYRRLTDEPASAGRVEETMSRK